MTSNQFEYITTYTDTPPTTCPVNIAHEVRDSSLVDEYQTRRLSLFRDKKSSTVNMWEKIGSILLDSRDIPDISKFVVATDGTGTYEFRVMDVINSRLLCTSGPLNTAGPLITEINPLNQLSGREVCELHVKTTGSVSVADMVMEYYDY